MSSEAASRPAVLAPSARDLAARRWERVAEALVWVVLALPVAFGLGILAVLLAVFLLTLLHWLLRYSVLFLTLRGLGSEIAWAWTFLVQMLALSAGQLSLLPGGAGSAELASAALLAPLVGKSASAAAIASRSSGSSSTSRAA